MAKDVGILTAVVLFSFLVSLALSQGILAAVLKAMSWRTSCLMERKARFIPSPCAEIPEESRLRTDG